MTRASVNGGEADGSRWRISVRGLATLLVGFSVLVGSATMFAAAAEAASPAWKPLAYTAPTYIPPKQSEVQRLTVEAAGGDLSLVATMAEGEGTLHFAHGSARATAGSAQLALLPFNRQGTFEVGQIISGEGIPPNTTIVGVPDASTLELSNAAELTQVVAVSAGSTTVTGVTTRFGAFGVGQRIEGVGVPPGTTIAAVSPGTITLSALPAAVGTVGLTASSSAEGIPYSVPARALESTLDALPGAGAGAFRVSGGPGGDGNSPYFIEFAGPFAETNVPALVPDVTALEGSHADARIVTTTPGGPGTGSVVVQVTDVGGAPASAGGSLTVGPLPPGILTAGQASGPGWNCSGGAGETVVQCQLEEPLSALTVARPLSVPIKVTTSVPFSANAHVEIGGGGAEEAGTDAEVVVSWQSAPPGVQAQWAGAFDSNGQPYTQAGGHPFSAMSLFDLNSVRATSGAINPAGDSKEIDVDLPPGFVGNPLSTPRCSQDTLLLPPLVGETNLCGAHASVGNLAPFLRLPGEHFNATKLYNDIPARGSAAQFTTVFVSPFQTLVASVRSEEGFGVRIAALQTPNYQTVFGAFAVLNGSPSGSGGRAFLANPTDCAQQAEEAVQDRGPATRITMSTYQQPSAFGTRSDDLPLLTGCDPLTEAWLGRGPQPLNEAPSFSLQPTTSQASSPTGATAVLRVPQKSLTDPAKPRTADLKKTVVTVPRGVSVNPASANGLQACSEGQIGYLGNDFQTPSPIRFNEEPTSCPDGSKLGTVQIKSPLLEEELEGTIYLAAQEENPFHSLIALYIAIESERFGLNLKLAGEVKPDPNTGQLTVTFDYNPQLPFEEFTLHFRGGGPRATLATPETCGHFETTGSLEPWSAEHGEALPITEAGFSTSGACASSEATRPFAPSFEAGTTGAQAGSYNPLVVKLNRKDGEQELKSIDFTLPKGLTGKLAGIPYCPEAAIREAESKSGKAEQRVPSCPAASQLGIVDTGAGVGSEPIHVGGKLYLAGPYKGAPFSSVVITPAVAGPFDLGDVVVRAPLFVDPETAQITAKSDPIPTILKGIPLKIRSVAINVNRSDFTLNPTNCESMSVTASIAGSSGATASPSNHFQVSGCKKLKFKPKLKISLKGSTKRIGHPALKAVVTYPKKGVYSNIARAQVNLPHSEFLDQGNLNKTCTKPALLAGRCPKKSIYGKAKAWTPLLDKPLQGPVYLVGGYGYKLPALVADLNGQIRVTLVGKVDSGPNKGIRNTFEAVPDAPVSRFVLQMKGGKKYGLLENSENLCRKKQRAIARFTAQNGAVKQMKPLITNKCRKNAKGKTKKH